MHCKQPVIPAPAAADQDRARLAHLRSRDGETYSLDAPAAEARCSDPLCSCHRAAGADHPPTTSTAAAADAGTCSGAERAAKRARPATTPPAGPDAPPRGSLRVLLRRGAFHSLPQPPRAGRTAELPPSWEDRALWAPHLVFAPNAGLAAYRSWVPTLRALAAAIDAPLVVTDYTEEARARRFLLPCLMLLRAGN